MRSFVLSALAVTPFLLATTPAPGPSTTLWPIKVSVKITCGGKTCTVTMKVDSGANGTTMSRANAKACGLLKADGSKSDPTLFGPDVTVKNATCGKKTFYRTKACKVVATDSYGNLCPFDVKIVVPSKGGSDISNLLGTDFLGEFCLSSPKKSCKIEWKDWKVVPDPKKKSVGSMTLEQTPEPSERVRLMMDGVAGGVPVVWTYGTGSTWVVLGDATADALQLKGTPIDLKALDPEYYELLDSTGFLGDNPSIPFEEVVLSSYGLVEGAESLVNEESRIVLINRQSNENILSQDAIDELPGVSETFIVSALGTRVLDLGAADMMSFGQAMPNTRGGPTLNVNKAPVIGATDVKLVSTHMDPGSSYILGFGDRVQGGMPIPGTSAILNINPVANMVGVAGPGGSTEVTLPVATSSLCGLELSVQMININASNRVSSSQGITLYVGN